MRDDFSLINKTKADIPRLPFSRIKDDILGKSYTLSLAFVGKAKSQELNKKYRSKDKPTNVLSFALSKKEGELVLCPAVVKSEAKNFDKNFTEFLLFLVIHGMLHLKGLEHSSKMERAEQLYYKKYDTKHFNRNRHRISGDESRSGRISKGRSAS